MVWPKIPIAKVILGTAVCLHFAGDLSRYIRRGEVNVWNSGWQSAGAHPVNLWINLALDKFACAAVAIATVIYALRACRAR